MQFIPIIAAIFMIITAILSIKRLQIKLGLPLSLSGICAAGWVLGIYFEYYIFPQNQILLPRIASIFAGTCVMGIATSVLILGLNYPERTVVFKGFRSLLIFIAIFIFPFTASAGTQFILVNGKVIRIPIEEYRLLHSIIFFIFNFVGVLLMWLKSRNYLSLLRHKELQLLPIAFFFSTTIGGIIGFFYNDFKYAMIFMTSMPILWVIILLLGSRRFYSKRININDILKKSQKDINKIKKTLLEQDIRISIYKKKGNEYISQEDGSFLMQPLPVNIPHMKAIFFEDTDSDPDSIMYNFFINNYADGLIIIDNNKLAILRTQSVILDKDDFLKITKLLSGAI